MHILPWVFSKKMLTRSFNKIAIQGTFGEKQLIDNESTAHKLLTTKCGVVIS